MVIVLRELWTHPRRPRMGQSQPTDVPAASLTFFTVSSPQHFQSSFSSAQGPTEP